MSPDPRADSPAAVGACSVFSYDPGRAFFVPEPCCLLPSDQAPISPASSPSDVSVSRYLFNTSGKNLHFHIPESECIVEPNTETAVFTGDHPPFPCQALSPKSLTQVPGPPTRPQQLGPCPQCPAPCPGPAHVHSLGLGCSSTSVCLKIFSVQFLVLSARARRLSKWASSSVFSA